MDGPVSARRALPDLVAQQHGQVSRGQVKAWAEH